MKEPSLDIRTAYFSAMNGNISLSGDNVPIYDMFAPPEPGYPYIILSSIQEIQRNEKRCKTYNVTIDVDIVTGNYDPIGREDSEKIAEQVEGIVLPSNFNDLSGTTDWEIGFTSRQNGIFITSRSNDYYIYRKVLTYSHLVSKK